MATTPRDSFATPARQYAPGIGKAVADRTINRKIKDAFGRDTVEEWADVAQRVAMGNALLHRDTYEEEFHAMHHHLRQASLLMSGRHLQHGDVNQPERPGEVFTNCSTSACSFLTFLLLLSGSGVGRSYDNDMMVVDWRNQPIVVPVLDMSHPDAFDIGIMDRRNAEHQYAGCDLHYFEVPDSREGWGKAVEKLEVMTFQKVYRDSIIILDFSKVRCKGSPIAGMQNRPASGPGPLIEALLKVATLRNTQMEPWRSTMFADHYLAECVLVGGARRAARMSTKYWRDQNIFGFIEVKRGGFLWSSNNSVTVDDDFWRYCKMTESEATHLSAEEFAWYEHANKVLEAVTQAAYFDQTGEPGLINVEKLTQKDEGEEVLLDGNFAGSSRYQLEPETLELTRALVKAYQACPFKMITNPCVTKDTWIHTAEGPRQVADLINTPYQAVINGKTYAATGFWKTGDKAVFKVTTDRGYELRLTENHQVLVEVTRKQRLGGGYNVRQEWVETKDLKAGDKLVLNDLSETLVAWGNQAQGEFNRGWLLGQMVGNGGYNPEKYPGYVRFWGDAQAQMAQQALAYAEYVCAVATRGCREYDLSVSVNEHNQTRQIASVRLDRLAEGLIAPESKNLLPALEQQSSRFYQGFIQAFFDADGTVIGDRNKGRSVRLSQANLATLKTVQRMLARLGIAATIYENRNAEGLRPMPDGNGGVKDYWCQTVHELAISKDNINRYAERIGFSKPDKAEKLAAFIGESKRAPYKERFTAAVQSIEADGVESVYDCTVADAHCFDANGIIAHNCGEICLIKLGAYCTIADVVPYHAQDLDDAEDAFRVATRALMRVNLMEFLYQKEVQRTNRIGIGMTGLHEFAWKFFGIGWKEMVNEETSKEFWLTLARFKRAVQDEAKRYAIELNVNVPQTDTTSKPAGTTSKLFSLTEGAHLPSMREYLRWVQFRNDDPLVVDYENKGYPVKKLKTYNGTTIVGFPTQPEICTLGMGDKLVTAPEATPEEQYQYLRLLEKYYIRGVDEDGVTPLEESGNQVSYTLKYDPKTVTYEHFKQTLLDGQSTIRCCSVMPAADTSAYEYQPETPVSREEFAAIVAAIQDAERVEDVSFEHVDCGSGACPISFNTDEKVTA